MQFTGMGYSAALAVVLAAGPANMALAQSADVSANATAGLTLVAQQQTYLDVMANLEAAGYTVVKTKTTFLGRVQITARNATHLREVVVSRATGEVKSDVILETFATGAPPPPSARCPPLPRRKGRRSVEFWTSSALAAHPRMPPRARRIRQRPRPIRSATRCLACRQVYPA
jgi:hypothetical protein